MHKASEASLCITSGGKARTDGGLSRAPGPRVWGEVFVTMGMRGLCPSEASVPKRFFNPIKLNQTHCTYIERVQTDLLLPSFCEFS